MLDLRDSNIILTGLERLNKLYREYIRRCKRCGKTYTTPAKFSKYCTKCYKPLKTVNKITDKVKKFKTKHKHEVVHCDFCGYTKHFEDYTFKILNNDIPRIYCPVCHHWKKIK